MSASHSSWHGEGVKLGLTCSLTGYNQQGSAELFKQLCKQNHQDLLCFKAELCMCDYGGSFILGPHITLEVSKLGP